MFQTFLVVLLLLLLPLLLLLFIKKTNHISNLNLPPSPPKLPFIGNLHQLGSQPHLSLRALANTYGPIMLLKLGHVPTVVISSPEIAKQVMKTHDNIFASRPHSEIAMIILSGSYDISFAPYGEYWRQTRKLCVSHLLSAKMVQSFRHVKEEEVKFMINNISQLSTSSLGAVNLSEVLELFVTNVISRIVSDQFSREDRKSAICELVKENTNLLGEFRVADFFPMFGWFDFSGVDSRAKKIANKWNIVLDEAIKEKVELRSANDDVNYKSIDFVDVMLSLEEESNIDYPFTKNNFKTILIDMFAGGIDTTSTALEYTMAELVRNPEVMAKLQAEVRGVAKGKEIITEDCVEKMSYLKVVIKEVMRLHPPVPLLLPRESMETCELEGYQIPNKTRVVLNAWAIARDPKIWENPDVFKPERFIGNSVDFKGNDFELIPFGAGRRICPGINFAMQTMELALANLVNKFDWVLPNDNLKDGLNMNETFGVVTRLTQRLHLVATQI